MPFRVGSLRDAAPPYSAALGTTAELGFTRNHFLSFTERSSKREYATGVASRVESSASVCPPMITKPVARLVPAPAPLDTTSGNRPATNAAVVIVFFGALLGGCSREQAVSIDGGAPIGSPATSDAATSGAATSDAATSDAATSDAPPRRLVDSSKAPKCTLTYHCGLSHPGLGRTSDAVTIDLGACSKTVTRSSVPYEPLPLPRDRPPAPPPKTKLARATCADLARRVGSITDRDASEAQESARRDSTACLLEARCPEQLIVVQRQSLSGSSPVVQLIQAMHAAR